VGTIGGIGRRHTVVALGNPVLYPPPLGKVRDLGPVLVRVGRGAEGAAGALHAVLPRGRRHLLLRGLCGEGVRRLLRVVMVVVVLVVMLLLHAVVYGHGGEGARRGVRCYCGSGRVRDWWIWVRIERPSGQHLNGCSQRVVGVAVCIYTFPSAVEGRPYGKMARTCFSMAFSTPITIGSEVGGTHAERLTYRDPRLYPLRRTAGVLGDDGADLFAVDQRVWLLTQYSLGCFCPSDLLCKGRFALVDGASWGKAFQLPTPLTSILMSCFN
jgi:hypothetical protein